MGDAFIYMYFVGFGTSLGILTSVAIGYFAFSRLKNRSPKKRKAILKG